MNWDERVAQKAQDAVHDPEIIQDLEYEDGFVDGAIQGAKWQRDQLRTDEAVERVALVLIEQRGYYIGEGWPTNEDLSGGPAGDRDVEFKSAWMDSAREIITALLGEEE